MTAFIVYDDVFEGADFNIDGQIAISSDTSDDGVLLVTSDVTGLISIDIFEVGDADPVFSTTQTAAQVIVNSPIPWRKDDIGRNFRYKVKRANVGVGVLKGGKRYRIIVRIPTAEDGELRCLWVPTIVALEV